jgi:hypothetical protein
MNVSLADLAITKQPETMAGYLKGRDRGNPFSELIDHTFLNLFYFSTVKTDEVMVVIPVI